MPILEVTSKTFRQISTTIGLLEPQPNPNVIRRQFDVIPKALILELEGFRKINWVDYSILEDPDIPDDREPQSNVPLIGEPTTGNYSGLLPILSAKDTIADAIQAIGEFNALIAPAKPGDLLGETLVVVGTTLFSAKVPSGLSAAWSALTPGSTIANMIVDGIFTLESPDQATRFIAGFANQLDTAGTLDLLEDTVVSESYDVATNGIGTIGRISITDIDVFNTIWQKVNAEFAISLISEGRHRFSMQHSEAGLSAESEFYFDDVNTAPTFSSALSASVNAIVSKYLSGIESIGVGSTIDVVYTAASGIFEKTYHPTAVGTITGDGLAISDDNPASTPAMSDTLPVSRTVTVTATNLGILSPQATATIRKPDGTQAQSNDTYGQPLNTYGTISTGKDEQFFDEARRIVLGSGTSSGSATAFTSSAALVNGNAQQRHSGILQYPDTTDYPGFTGDQIYERFFDKVSASNGQLTFVGIGYTDVDPYGTGDLNVLLELATEGIYYDLGQPIGSDNGAGDGSSPADSIGGRNDILSSGGTLAWSIGTNSTANNTNEYRLIVIFRNTTHSISRITEA